MGSAVLRVEGLSKKFCRSLKRSLWYGVKDLGSELFLTRGLRDQLRRDEFWALRDLSFEVGRGETFGLVGHNGAGKSTLLKLINGLIRPDVGRINTDGRIGALIELGTGFHPVLSGRENIYVNASILGLRRKDVNRRLEEIIEFAEIGDFIDAPVQTYSSGMKVRLGFSIASHLNPDILLIDEILSVGDASFRQRCMNRLADYKRDGGTVIFVSHNPVAVESICDRVMLIDHGHVVGIGDPVEMIKRYEEQALEMSRRSDERLRVHEAGQGAHDIQVSDVELFDVANRPQSEFDLGEHFEVRFRYRSTRRLAFPHFTVAIQKDSRQNPYTAVANMLWDGIHLEEVPAEGTVGCAVTSPPLSPGFYRIYVGVQSMNISGLLGEKWYLPMREVGSFVIRPEALKSIMPGIPSGSIAQMPPLILQHAWRLDGEPVARAGCPAEDEVGQPA
jgi:lipopolysaccharide transport system ATP-binding protein